MSTEINNIENAENTVATAKNGQLFKMLTADHSGVRQKRAGNFNERLQNAFAKDLQTEVDALHTLETELLEMTDFYPETETSLRVVDPNFNPEKWTKRYNELTLSIKLQTEVVNNIKENIANLF